MSRIYGQSKSRLKRLKRLVLFMLTDVPDTIMRRTILKKVDKVITVSDGVGEIFVRSGFRRNLIATVYNVPPGASSAPGDGSEVRQRYALGEKRVVLFAGKVSIGKGKDLLFDAIPCVVKQVPNVVFVLAGRWQSPEDLPESCRSSVRYLGVLPNHEVIALYECADVVVVPSVWPEPLSRVILEAMSAGCPVVATRVGGTPEMVIDGENGLLVFPHDPQELAQALVTVLSQRQLREDMGQRSRAILKERFSGEQSLLKLEAIYQKAVA